MDVPVDGRARRGQRSRAAIVQALFDLVGEGERQPTAQQVAERARVGLRSVFRHFADMESLYAEVDARVREHALPLFEAPLPTGSREARAHELVARRARLFDVKHYLCFGTPDDVRTYEYWAGYFATAAHHPFSKNGHHAAGHD